MRICEMRGLICCLTSALIAVTASGRKDEGTFADDDATTLKLLRARLSSERLVSKYAVVMLAGPRDFLYLQHSVPIWRAYCERHGLDFFLQQRSLNLEVRFEWTKLRLLLEILGTKGVRWHYVWVPDPHSLPVDFGRKWTYAIKAHMRYKDLPNRKVNRRVIWCPWDCEEGGNSRDSCYGPDLSGCIFWLRAGPAKRLVRNWYELRSGLGQDEMGMRRALEQPRLNNYDEVSFRNVQEEMGKSVSSFLATFTYDEKFGANVKEAILDAIQSREALRQAARSQTEAHGEFRPEL